MDFPEELKYTKDHEWVKVEGDTLIVGITSFAQSELGDIVYVELTAEEGEETEQSEVFGTIEAVKTVSDLFLPVTGSIETFNEELEDSPELVNEDPYGKGWIVKMKPSDMSQLDDLMSASEYKEMTGN